LSITACASDFTVPPPSVREQHSTNEPLGLVADHNLNLDAVFLFYLGNKGGDVHVRLGLVPIADKQLATDGIAAAVDQKRRVGNVGEKNGSHIVGQLSGVPDAVGHLRVLHRHCRSFLNAEAGADERVAPGDDLLPAQFFVASYCVEAVR
jgi:hypothetical protein